MGAEVSPEETGRVIGLTEETEKPPETVMSNNCSEVVPLRMVKVAGIERPGSRFCPLWSKRLARFRKTSLSFTPSPTTPDTG